MQFNIVIPSFNQAQFLEETIKSVLAQNGDFSVAIFVADGGSTDKSVQILKKYKNKISFVSEKDRGQTHAINKGIAYFSSLKLKAHENTVFAYINSDDYYLPGAFSKVMTAFAENPQAQWVVGDAVIVNSSGSEIQNSIRFYKRVWRSIFSFFVLSILNPIPQPSTFVRWQAVEHVGMFNEDLRYVMDYEYWMRLLSKKFSPLMLKTTLSSFRIHGDSKGGSQFEKQFAEELKVARAMNANPLALALHTLHNFLIVISYKILK